MIDVKSTLESIGASDLAGGNQTWGPAWCPYTLDELNMLDTMNADENESVKDSFRVFLEKFNALSGQEKIALRAWSQIEYVDPIWKKQKSYARHEFSNKHFFPRVKRTSGKMLEVGSSHGVYGALLYRDHYKYGLEIHTNDMVPCNNKLLAIMGFNVQHVNLKYDSLAMCYNDSFDVITLTEVLEHVDQKTEDFICSDLHKITQPGSQLFITFPVVAMGNGKPLPNDPLGHIRQPTVAEVKSKLHEFQVESGEFSNGKQNIIYMTCKRV